MLNIPYSRWMIRRDLAEVLDIEQLSFPFPWSEEDLIKAVRQQMGTVPKVLELNDRVIGYCFYELSKNSLEIINLAIHPDFRRKGNATIFINKIKEKLSPDRRNLIKCRVADYNLEAQLFWCAMGFKAIKVEKNFYKQENVDAYLFTYNYTDSLQETMTPYCGENYESSI